MTDDNDDPKAMLKRKIAPFLNLLLVEKKLTLELSHLVLEIAKDDGINAEQMYDRLADLTLKRNKDWADAVRSVHDLLFALSVPFDQTVYQRDRYELNQERRRRQQRLAARREADQLNQYNSEP